MNVREDELPNRQLFLRAVGVIAFFVGAVFLWQFYASRLDVEEVAHPRDIPKLIRQLEDSDLQVRGGALRSIGELGPEGREILPKLIEMLEGGNKNPLDEAETIAILYAIGQTGRFGISAIDILRKYLNHPHAEVQSYALWALGRVGLPTFGSVDDALISDLEKRYVEKQGQVKDAAAGALFRVKKERAQELEQYGDLRSKELSVQFDTELDVSKQVALVDALRSVFFLGSLAKGAVKELTPLLAADGEQGTPAEVRMEVVRALGQIDAAVNSLLDPILDAMQYDADPTVRKTALLALRSLGTPEALKLAKLYGHKFKDGGPRPEKVDPHPFRAWVISNKTELTKHIPTPEPSVSLNTQAEELE